MMKRILSFIMSMVMLLSALPLQAFASNVELVEIPDPTDAVAIQELTEATESAASVVTEPAETAPETEAPAEDVPETEAPADVPPESPEPTAAATELNIPAKKAMFSAATGFTYTVLNGTFCEITGYSGTAGSVTIPAEIDGYIVQSLGNGLFSHMEDLTSVVFPSTIERMGAYLFDSCTALTEVRLNEELEEIGDHAFLNCTSLQEITIPGNVSALGSNVFENCTALTSVTLSDGLTAISDYAFTGCIALESVELPDGLLTVNNFAFRGCTSLEEIVLPDSIQNLGYEVFANCTALTSVNYPTGLTTMLSYYRYGDNYGRVFAGCTNLKTLEIPEGVTAIPANALRECALLEEVILPDSLEPIGSNAFYSCTGLKTIQMKNNVSSVGSYAFYGCTALEEVAFSDSLTSMGEYAFAGSTALEEIILPGSLETVANYAFQDCSGLRKLTLSEGTAQIGVSSFENCTSLTDISLPESLTTIHNFAFRGCTALEEVTLPDTVHSMGYETFANCSALTSVNYPADLTAMLSYYRYGDNYGRVFAGCTNLKTLEIPEGVTAIPANALRECALLEEVILPESLETIGSNAFYGCTGLKTIQMKNGVSSVGSYAFYGCSALEEVAFSDSLTSMGEYAFAGCTGLTEVSLPGSLEMIANYAFQDCSGLRKLTVSAGTAQIGVSTFENCTGLTNISLPDTLTTVHNFAFRGCSALRKVTLPDSIQNMGYEAFASCSHLNSINYPINLTAMLSYYRYGDNYGRIFADCTSLLTLKIPQGVTAIPASAFFECACLEEVILPDSLEIIGNNAFSGCTGLEKIWIDEAVAAIGSNAFANCSALTIHGVEGSYAQIFADSKGIPFSTEILDYPTSSISGLVANKDGKGIPDVTVTLYDLTWDRKQDILTTDETGAWSSDAMIIGHDYLLIFYHAEYDLENRNQRFTIGETPIEAETVVASEKGSLPETDVKSFVYSVLNGTYCKILDYTGTDPVVNIPVEINGYIVQSLGDDVFRDNKTLTAVAIPYTVESIGSYAFSGCTALEEIILPSSMESIGVGAFENCTALESAELSEGLLTVNNFAFRGCTSLEEILLPDSIQNLGYEVFANCTALTTVNYPANLTAMLSYYRYGDNYGRIFAGCTNLKSITIPEGVTAIPANALRECDLLEEVILPESLETIGDNAFYGCSSLKSVVMKNQVTTIGRSAFGYCSALEQVTFSENLASIGEYSFESCTALEEIILPGSLEAIANYAFINCSGLRKLTLSEGTAQISVSSFENCTSLTDISLPESLTTIHNFAFRGCTALEEVTLPDTVHSMGYEAFANCTALTSVNYPADLTTMLSYYRYGDNYGRVFAGCTNLKTLEIPEGVTAIPANALRECALLEEVILPESLETIGDNAFYNCTGLKALEMKNQVTGVGNSAFRNCTGLKTLTLSERLISMGEYVFAGCTGLTEVSLPGSLDAVANYAFQDCSGLRKLTVSEGTAQIGVSSFENCTGLSEITLPETLITVHNFAFRGCVSLKTLILPDSIQNMGYEAFANCSHLSSINYPVSLTTMLSYYRYGDNYGRIFAGCTSLLTLKIPQGVTAIPNSAFFECACLEEVILPDTLTAIGDNAFKGCSGLEKIWIDEAVTSIGSNSFANCSALTIHGVEGSYAQSFADSKGIPFSTEPLVYPTGAISGLITDKDGNGIPGITVTLYDLTWDRKQDILTSDETGAWSSEEVIIGHDYLLIFYHTEYDLENRNQRFTIGETPIEAETVIATAKEAVPGTGAEHFTYAVLNGTYCQITGYTGTETAVSIPAEIDGYIVQRIADSVFQNNKALTAVVIPDTVETIGSYVFSGCSALTDVRLNEGLEQISDYTFQNCISLEEITLPGSVETIGVGAFENCTALESVELSEGLLTVNNFAFRGCTALEEILLPDSIQNLGYEVFANCTALTSVNYPADLTAMLSYYRYGDNYGRVFAGCTNLKSITIPEGVTAIPANALRECALLEEVILPESLETIGSNAFYGCTGLKTIQMKNQVTSVGSYAFYGCTALKEITLSDSLSSMGEYAFAGCTGLTEVSLPGSLETVANYAFQNCSGLRKLTLSEGTAQIGVSSFENCTSLTDISLPESLTTIHNFAFRDCTALEEVTLPDTVHSMGYEAFANCTGLSSINYPADLTAMLSYYRYGDNYGRVFAGCTNLKSITIPEGVTAIPANTLRECALLEEVILPESLETIGDNAFYGCSSLKSVEMKNQVTTIGRSAFGYCTALEEVAFSDSLTSMGEYAFVGCTALEEVILPGSLETVANYAFQDCSGLRKLTVSAGTAQIGVSSFENCTGLSEITLPESMTTIHNFAFRGCTALEEVTLPDTVHSMGYEAFANCTGLSSINYPADLTAMLSYYRYGDNYGRVVAGCTNLKTVTIPEGVTAIPAYAFFECEALEEIVFPGSLKTLGTNAFEGCSKLRTVKFNEGLTAIPDYGFRNCTSLSVADIPSTVTRIGKYAFYNCLGLRIVNLGSSVVSIGDYAFYGCDGLLSLVLNDGLTAIGSNTFADCANLQSVEIPESVTSIQKNSFHDCDKLTVYCNSGSQAHMVGEAAGLDIFLLDEHEHIFQSAVETLPDCTRDGSQIMTCTICGYYYIDILDALGHTDGDWTTLVKPTCTEDGIRILNCSVCEREVTRDLIPRYGHSESDWETAEGNCVDGGHQIKSCSICHTELDRKEIPAAGHKWGELIVESTASVLCDGISYRTCSVCEEREEFRQDKLEVDISSNENYGLVHLTIVNAATLEPISGAGVFISTEKDGEVTLATDANGRISQILPVGAVNLSVFADGFQTRSITITVEPGEQELPQLGISDGYLVEGKLTAEEMTYEEMLDAGIDVTDPDNQHHYKYALVLEFAPEIDWLSIMFYMDDFGLPNVTGVIGPVGPIGPSGPTGPSNPGEGGSSNNWSIVYGPSGGGGGGRGIGVTGYLPDGQKVTVHPVNERFYLIIYGEVHWVKEMYHVELLTINHSMTDTVENAEATLFLPDGLSLAKMVGEQQTLTQRIGTIGCGESKSVHWYIRGDREGTYSFSATLQGHMLPFGDAFSYSYEVEDPIKVYAGSAMHLTFHVPDSAFTGEEYTVRIELENVSDKTLYNVTHAITDIDQFRVTEYSNGMVEVEEYPVVGGTGYIFIPEFRPGDVIVIETTTVIMFQSKLIEYQKDQIRKMLSAVKGFMEGFEAFETGIGLIGSVTDWLGLAADAVQDYVDDIVVTSSEREILANSIARQLADLNEALSGEPTARKMQKIQELKSAGVWDEIQKIIDNPQLLDDYSGRELTRLATKLSTANAIQDNEFDAFDAVDKMIDLIPVRFRLTDAWVATLEGSTTVIPSTIVVHPVGAHYFGVENVSRYIASLMQLYMADIVADSIPIDILGDKFKEGVGYYDALDYVRTVENEASLYKITGTAGASFRAWIERADAAAFSSPALAADPEFDLSFTSNTNDPALSGTLDENGVLTFTGSGTLRVTPRSQTPGVLCVEMEDGTIKRYNLDVVQEHDCDSAEWTVMYAPSADMQGLKAKYCDICGEVVDMAAMTACDSHEFSDYVTLLEPTVESAGKEARTCIHCGAEEIRYTDALSAGSYVAITSDKEFLVTGETAALTARILPGTMVDTQILWTLEEGHEEFAALKITESGAALTAAAGLTEKRDVTVTAYTPGDLADAGSITITVYPKTLAVNILSGDENVTGRTLPFDLNADSKTLTLRAESMPADAFQTFQWLSGDEDIATVEDGTVTFTGTDGKVKITATALDGSRKSASVTIQTVRVPHNVQKDDEVEGDADIAILGGKSRDLVVRDLDTGTALTAKQITWQVPEQYAAFASVNAKGKLTTKKVVTLTRIEVLGTIVNSTDDPVVYVIDIYPSAAFVEILDETDTLVNNRTLKLNFSQTLDLSALVYPADAMEDVTWKSSSEKIASVDQNGIVRPNEDGKSGTVTITATANDGSKKKASVKVQVGTAVNSVTITEPASRVLRSGKSMTLKAVTDPVKPGVSGVTWVITQGSEYATISASGSLKAKTVNEATPVTVIAVSKDAAKLESDPITITILPKADETLLLKKGSADVTGQTLSLDSLTDGASLTLSAWFTGITGGTAAETAAQSVTWTSSDSTVVSLSAAEGETVTATLHKADKATITATALIDGRTFSAKVTIKGSPLVKTLRITAREAANRTETGIEVASGKSVTLVAEANDTAASKKVTWAVIQGEAFASVSGSGKLTAAKDLTAKQTVTVRATAADGSGTVADTAVTIRPAALGMQVYTIENGVQTFSVESSGSIWVRNSTTTVWDQTTQGSIVTLNADVYPFYRAGDDRNAMQAVTWKSSAANIADFRRDAEGNLILDNSGNIQLEVKKPGKTNITVTAQDGSKQSVKFTLNAVRNVSDLELTPQVLASGKSLNLAKLIQPMPADTTTKKFSWSITGGDGQAYVTLSSSGTLKAKAITGRKQVIVTATAQDSGAYGESFVIDLYPAAKAVTLYRNTENVTGGKLPVAPGDTFRLTAASQPADALQAFTWVSSKPQLVSVSDGTVTVLGESGTAVITCTAADGTGKKASVTLQIG